MIELYAAPTANGRRAATMLEECKLAYRTHTVDLAVVEKPAKLLQLNPLGAIPTILDHDGPEGNSLAIAQSGAILLYLADKTGKFLPRNLVHARHHQRRRHQQHPLPDGWLASRHAAENGSDHLFLSVIDARLGQTEHLAGDLSIADLALYPLMFAWKPMLDDPDDLASVKTWMATLADRPGVVCGMNGPHEFRSNWRHARSCHPNLLDAAITFMHAGSGEADRITGSD